MRDNACSYDESTLEKLSDFPWETKCEDRCEHMSDILVRFKEQPHMSVPKVHSQVERPILGILIQDRLGLLQPRYCLCAKAVADAVNTPSARLGVPDMQIRQTSITV